MKAVFTSLFILCFTMTSAQNFDAGLIGGFSTSQVTGDNLSGFDKLGSRFGAYISYPINKKMSYQMEMQFLQKGSKKPYTKNSPEIICLNSITSNFLYIKLRNQKRNIYRKWSWNSLFSWLQRTRRNG